MMTQDQIIGISITALLASASLLAVVYYSRKRIIREFKVEHVIVKEKLSMMYVVNRFKSLNLDPKKDTPFIARKEFFQKKTGLNLKYKQPEGYEHVNVLGVLNESTNVISHLVVLYSPEADADIEAIFGTEIMVVLN